MNDTARTILSKNNYCVVSTVTAEGAPWATPVHFAYDDKNIYWLSQPSSVHSTNIARDGRAFITVYDSRQTAETLDDRGALYIATVATELQADAAMAARDIYADRYPDDNDRKLVDWSVYAAPIGAINEEKTSGSLVYFTNTGNV